jgi:hypothetical protein
MSTCKIGPITFDRGFYYEKGNDYGVMDGKEQFTVKGPIQKINQLRGLVTRGKSQESNDITIRGSNSKDWGPIWVDAAKLDDDTRDNVRLNHKGWYLLRNVDITHVNEYWAKATLTLELITNHPLEHLECDYTSGINAGTVLKHSYELEGSNVLFEDDFSTYESEDYVDSEAYNMTGSTITSDGSKLKFYGKRTSGAVSPNYGARVLTSKETFNPPFFVECDLQNPDLGSANCLHHVRLMITPIYVPNNKWIDTFDVVNHIKNQSRYLRISKYSNVQRTDVVYEANSLSTKNVRVFVDENGIASVWVHDGSDYVLEWQGPIGLSKNTELHVALAAVTYDPAYTNEYVSNIKVYTEGNAIIPTMVKVPSSANLLSTPDQTEGVTSFFKNPTSQILLQSDIGDMDCVYANSPLGYSSNNPSNTYQLVTGNYERLLPGKFYVQNGDIRLFVNSDGIGLYKYYNGNYNLVMPFSFGTINFLKILNCTPDVFKFQANLTEWCMRRGEPYIYVKHPYDALGYTRKNRYYHDGILESLGTDTDLSMEDQFYSLIITQYNMLTTNQYNGTEDGTINGFYPLNSGVISSSTDYSYTGARSLKCLTPNAVSGEGFALVNVTLPNNYYNGYMDYSCYLRGSGTVKLYGYEYNSSGSQLDYTESSVVTLSSTWQPVSVRNLFSENGARAILGVKTASQQAATIYGDAFSVAPTPLDAAISYTAPSVNNRYALMIMKKDPCTIKSDSIPASSITGLGVYDQMQPPNTCTDFEDLAYSWLNLVDQRLRIVKV